MRGGHSTHHAQTCVAPEMASAPPSRSASSASTSSDPVPFECNRCRLNEAQSGRERNGKQSLILLHQTVMGYVMDFPYTESESLQVETLAKNGAGYELSLFRSLKPPAHSLSCLFLAPCFLPSAKMPVEIMSGHEVSETRQTRNWKVNKMKPTNPNAHTYVNGIDVKTHGYAAVTHNTFLQ